MIYTIHNSGGQSHWRCPDLTNQKWSPAKLPDSICRSIIECRIYIYQTLIVNQDPLSHVVRL